MGEGEETHRESETIESRFPLGRVKRIVKLDRDINKINSEALLLISKASEVFVRLLTEKACEVAVEKKRKTITLEHLRVAVKRHRPTADFLVDSLPIMFPPSLGTSSNKTTHNNNNNNNNNKNNNNKSSALPVATRGIDTFFKKCG